MVTIRKTYKLVLDPIVMVKVIYSPRFSKEEIERIRPFVDTSLERFPELDSTLYTQKRFEGIEPGVLYIGKKMPYSQHGGEAVVQEGMIRLKPDKIRHYIVGHELTHLLQESNQLSSPIPRGEIQCDIWTIARDRLFLDCDSSYIGKRVGYELSFLIEPSLKSLMAEYDASHQISLRPGASVYNASYKGEDPEILSERRRTLNDIIEQRSNNLENKFYKFWREDRNDEDLMYSFVANIRELCLTAVSDQKAHPKRYWQDLIKDSMRLFLARRECDPKESRLFSMILGDNLESLSKHKQRFLNEDFELQITKAR